MIDGWHKSRGWTGIGYHHVILNGYPGYRECAAGNRIDELDGCVQVGRPEGSIGAHCLGHNRDSIGICLIGNLSADKPTEKQWNALLGLCFTLCRKYGLDANAIFGHRELRATKCPGDNLALDLLRTTLHVELRGGETIWRGEVTGHAQ